MDNSTFTNDWTTKKEQEILSWINTCYDYIDAHLGKKVYCERMSSFFIIATVIASTISTIFSGITSFEEPTTLRILGTIFSGIVTGLGVCIERLNVGKKIELHNNTIIKYRLLINEIKNQLNMNPTNRIPCNDFMKSTMEQMINFESGENSIPILSKNEFSKYDFAENPEIQHKDNNELKDVKMTDENKHKFEIFFKSFPSKNNAMLKYQLDRLHNV